MGFYFLDFFPLDFEVNWKYFYSVQCYLVIGVQRVKYSFASPPFCTGSNWREEGRCWKAATGERLQKVRNSLSKWNNISSLRDFFLFYVFFYVYWWFFLLKGSLLTNSIIILLVCVEGYEEVSCSSHTGKLPLWNPWNSAILKDLLKGALIVASEECEICELPEGSYFTLVE